MTVQRDVLERHLEELLEPGAFSDYAPNGLQVEGRDTVRHLAVGVSANQALIDRAVEIGAGPESELGCGIAEVRALLGTHGHGS